MKNISRIILTIALVFLSTRTAMAIGTQAGTTITNTATANYNLGGAPATPETASDSFDVVEVIRMTMTWQDGANVAVTTPDTARVLTFEVTNTGNGSEDFTFSTNDALGGDDFNPSGTQVWYENGLAAGLQTSGGNMDVLHNPGVNDPTLADDGTLTVYVVCNIPAGLSDTNTGDVAITATSTTTGASGSALGAVLVGGEVVGVAGANAAATGTYIVSSVSVTLTKAITGASDPFGGTEYVPGATITYRITVSVAGSGTAEALVITDPIPGDMTYAAGTISVDSTGQTDAGGDDSADFNVTNANTVTVDFGDTAAPATHTIDFNVTIN